MTDLPNGRQTRITDEQVVATTDHICKALSAQKVWSVNYAQDIYQEIYIALHKARDRYDPTKGVTWSSYAFNIAQFAVKSFYRSNPLIGVVYHRHTHSVTYHDDFEAHALSAVGVSFDHGSLAWELERYTPREKKILILLMAGYSPSEIANYLHTTPAMAYRLIADLRIKSSPSYSSHHTDIQQKKHAA